LALFFALANSSSAVADSLYTRNLSCDRWAAPREQEICSACARNAVDLDGARDHLAGLSGDVRDGQTGLLRAVGLAGGHSRAGEHARRVWSANPTARWRGLRR
jgi:hypothetical protein